MFSTHPLLTPARSVIILQSLIAPNVEKNWRSSASVVYKNLKNLPKPATAPQTTNHCHAVSCILSKANLAFQCDLRTFQILRFWILQYQINTLQINICTLVKQNVLDCTFPKVLNRSYAEMHWHTHGVRWVQLNVHRVTLVYEERHWEATLKWFKVEHFSHNASNSTEQFNCWKAPNLT